MREVARFPLERSSTKVARAWVARVLSEQGLAALVSDAELCVSELTANAIRHARTPFEIAVEVDHEGGTVRVAVTDDNFRPVQARLDPQPTSLTGHGLRIVAAVASSWGVIDHDGDGKTVWFTLGPGDEGVRSNGVGRPRLGTRDR
jgi:anti-sigma regulatory factor (Ser/Thr protein kinase)